MRWGTLDWHNRPHYTPAIFTGCGGIVFFLAYVIYVQRTLTGGGEMQAEDTLNPLIIEPRRGRRAKSMPWPRRPL